MYHLLEASFFATIALPAVYYFTRIENHEIQSAIASAVAFSFLAFAATYKLVPMFSWYLARRGLKGKDYGRRGTPQENEEMYVQGTTDNRTVHFYYFSQILTLFSTISLSPPPPFYPLSLSPSAVGLVCAAVYLTIVIATQLYSARGHPEMVRKTQQEQSSFITILSHTNFTSLPPLSSPPLYSLPYPLFFLISSWPIIMLLYFQSVS